LFLTCVHEVAVCHFVMMNYTLS